MRGENMKTNLDSIEKSIITSAIQRVKDFNSQPEFIEIFVKSEFLPQNPLSLIDHMITIEKRLDESTYPHVLKFQYIVLDNKDHNDAKLYCILIPRADIPFKEGKNLFKLLKKSDYWNIFQNYGFTKLQYKENKLWLL